MSQIQKPKTKGTGECYSTKCQDRYFSYQNIPTYYNVSYRKKA
jgi:hypothetical protein